MFSWCKERWVYLVRPHFLLLCWSPGLVVVGCQHVVVGRCWPFIDLSTSNVMWQGQVGSTLVGPGQCLKSLAWPLAWWGQAGTALEPTRPGPAHGQSRHTSNQSSISAGQLHYPVTGQDNYNRHKSERQSICLQSNRIYPNLGNMAQKIQFSGQK